MADVDSTNVETTHESNAKALDKLHLSSSKGEEEEENGTNHTNNKSSSDNEEDNNNNNNNKERRVEYVSPEDPNYSTDRTVLADPTNFTIKHPLQNRWTLWYDSPGKKTSQESWAEGLKRIVTFDTVEDFWSVFNNIRPASKLVTGSNYHLFKEHIEPKWEHSENAKGGKWIVTVSRGLDLDKLWLWSVLALIGESFEDENEICGCVVSRRRPNDRLALWTKTGHQESAQRRIGTKLKQIIELPEKEAIGYQIHADSLKRNSSYNNRNRYTV